MFLQFRKSVGRFYGSWRNGTTGAIFADYLGAAGTRRFATAGIFRLEIIFFLSIAFFSILDRFSSIDQRNSEWNGRRGFSSSFAE